MFFPLEQTADVLGAWTGLLPALPDEITSWANVLHFPPLPDVPSYARGRSFAILMAAYLGDQREGRALLQPLRELRPIRDSFAVVPPVVLGDLTPGGSPAGGG